VVRRSDCVKKKVHHLDVSAGAKRRRQRPNSNEFSIFFWELLRLNKLAVPILQTLYPQNGLWRKRVKAIDLFRVEGQVCLVTGGANGLGAAIAEALADNGADVILLDRDAKAIEAAVEAGKAKGWTISGLVADLADRPELRRRVGELAARKGSLDVVFANAGITAGPGFLTPDFARDAQGAIENISAEMWRRVVAVNLTGAFATLQASAPAMKAARRGRMIVTASIAAWKTSPMVGTPYVATKGGVAHIVRQVASEMAAYNVLVNAILPGPFLTRITTPELEEGFKRASPSHRAANLHEIQGLALFLASRASSFVTGAHYVIDGGTLLGRAD
jgi:NAD(P)-dependent dehydrogenase (short-subunit alcohol dehydrogenase family)